MPYFHVEIAQNNNAQFVVNAADKISAEDIALMADAAQKCDHKKVVKLNSGSSSSISITEVDKSVWLDTLKKAKSK